ncbi:translation initiation factor IF-2 [Aquimarina agarivorans]|uniref:translation initiation factor IF-2 n=1 Tax=Aquimarina agarivorans TaxID=980584 RepID=UPI000248FDAA|nr:translation initiation factor IF-2 [Aquimarina agarivorans]
MAGVNNMRLNKVLREFNISLDRAVDFLSTKGHEIEARPTTKISAEIYQLLTDEFQGDKSKKVASKEKGEEKRKEKEAIRIQIETEQEERRKKAQSNEVVKAKAKLDGPKQVGKIELNKPKQEVPANTSSKPEPVAPKEEAAPVVKKEEVPATPPKEPAKKAPDTPEVVSNRPKKQGIKITGQAPIANEKSSKPKVNKIDEVKAKAAPVAKQTPPAAKAPKHAEVGDAPSEKVKTQYKKLDGPNFTGQKIDLSQFKKPEKKKDDKNASNDANKRKRKRISKGPNQNQGGGGNRGNNRGKFQPRGKRAPIVKAEPTEEEVQKQVRETLEKLQGKSGKGKGAKYRRDKRDQHRQKTEEDQAAQAAESKVIKVTEFVTASEVATMMDVSVTQIISACMSLGMMVTMNQRLDAETLTIVADEFGYTVDFVTADIEQAIEEVVDAPEDLTERAPIVTVMGHVDHGKTSLLDYIRKENVIAGESGGITQHIGAYGVQLESGQKIAFLDTPGHEAFTAMRARGAQVTDIAIIVIAADDDIMPQTKEAISHAQAAGVPIIFAINKVDKETANPDNIKTKLAAMNLLVEEWGGKIQSHDISAKTGLGVNELLEKVLLEAELLELKANPDRTATGTVVEAFLDKGRGYVSTVLVQSGTLKVGDYILAGKNSGKVKAMQDERGNRVEQAGPSTPVSVLGLDGAPQAGDKFNVMDDEREAKDIASKRAQLHREQSVRTQRHITLDEIGRRIALGDFKELNIILKGDVDGSVEALTDSFQKLSTDEIHVNIIHKAVGAITESDVLLASASDAIIIGFNVRPAGNARMVADKEEIDIRMYSIIYDAINDLKDAMEGMLSPEMKEEITGTAEIRQTFKISKIGTIAGCMVLTGKIFRNNQIRLIRESVVIYTGELAALKRFKDDVKEVAKGYDCGMQIKNYNDIKEGDIIEAFQEVAVKKKLK